MRRKLGIFVWLGALWALLWAWPAHADGYLDIHALLDAWQVEAAEAAVARLSGDTSARADFLRARVAFERGDYQAAQEALKRAGSFAENQALDFRPYLMAAIDATRGFAKKQSAHAEIRYLPGKDEVLAEGALETIEKARAALLQDLGDAPAERIVIEVYPKPEMLARATGLPMEAIRKTGTIAICKWNRIMMITPRASVMGYPWRDTLTHEYTHMIIARVSANRVPIWLHEGIAKFEEERWRSSSGTPLEPTRESLLARALREDKLVTLEQMNPSMSLLPSQQHGALAYTEVLSMIRWLTERYGRGVLPRLLRAVRTAPSLDEAMRQAISQDVSGFEASWKRDSRRGGLRELSFEFDDYSILFGSGDGGKGGEEQELRGIKSRRGRQYMTLGKLLKDRQHPIAASVEFEKAAQSLGPLHPVLQNLIAEGLLAKSQYREAAARLTPTLGVSPDYLPTRQRLARAYLGLEDYAKAAENLEIAYAQNPFDPSVLQGLALCYEKLGNGERSEWARRHLAFLN